MLSCCINNRKTEIIEKILFIYNGLFSDLYSFKQPTFNSLQKKVTFKNNTIDPSALSNFNIVPVTIIPWILSPSTNPAMLHHTFFHLIVLFLSLSVAIYSDVCVLFHQ